MKDGCAIIGVCVMGLVVIVGLAFGLSALGLVHYQFFAPKFQAAERKVYEETPSYVQGKEQTLSELRLEYQKAKTSGQKENIRSMIINEAATVDLQYLKDRSLRHFIEDLREGD